MRWGTLKEGVVLLEWATRRGVFASKPDLPFVSGRWPFARANLDGIAMITDAGGNMVGSRIIEVKCSRSDAGWGEQGTDEVPEAYRIQALHQMACCQWADRVEFAVLIGASDYREYTVMRDDAAIESLMMIEARLWQRVLDRDPPPPTTAEDVALLHPVSRPIAREATPDVVEAVATIGRIKAEMADLEKEEKLFSDIVKVCMGEAEVLAVGEIELATWRSSARTDVDIKALRAAQPALCKEFERTAAVRRFLLKGSKASKH